MLENSDKTEPFLTIESIFGLKTSPQRKKNFIERQFWTFWSSKVVMKLLYLGHGQSYFRLFLFLLSLCDLLLWEFSIFCNILKRFYSRFFPYWPPTMMEFNMTDSLHIQITFDPFSFIRISAKNLVKDGHYEFFFSLIILSLILFGVIGSDFFSYLALKVISSTRPVGNFCASLMGSEICSDECYTKKW